MEYILLYGLRSCGEPLEGHIPLNKRINNVNNWANAIFVSPSIFYASKYSEIIYSDYEEWYIIIEANIEPNCFSMYESTIYKYNFKMWEPKKIEYRINNISSVVGGKDESCIETTSLLFVKKKFLDNSDNYLDSLIFEKD